MTSSPERLLARRRYPGTFYRQSSASTDTPLRVAYDPLGAAWSWANEYRVTMWFGVDICARTLMIMHDMYQTRRRSRVQDWIRNRRSYLANCLSPEALEEASRFVLNDRPRLCWGLPSVMFQLARHFRARYPDATHPAVPFVKVGGEPVLRFHRADIEKYLGARVIQGYGSSEMGAVAWECPEGSLHVFREHVHVEILGEDGQPVPPGESGEVVLTSLTNRAMPLVRYRVGDRARMSGEPCRCRLPHPVMREIEGRATDVLPAVDGTLVRTSRLAIGARGGRRRFSTDGVPTAQLPADRRAALARFRRERRGTRRWGCDAASGGCPPGFRRALRGGGAVRTHDPP